jgi:hypothetical protein
MSPFFSRSGRVGAALACLFAVGCSTTDPSPAVDAGTDVPLSDVPVDLGRDVPTDVPADVPSHPCTTFCVRGRQNCGFDCCIDPLTDARHCGDCGHACDTGLVCRDGVCAP